MIRYRESKQVLFQFYLWDQSHVTVYGILEKLVTSMVTCVYTPIVWKKQNKSKIFQWRILAHLSDLWIDLFTRPVISKVWLVLIIIWKLSKSSDLNTGLAFLSVVYFDQHLGAPHSKRWWKYLYLCLWHAFVRFWCKKDEKWWKMMQKYVFFAFFSETLSSIKIPF